MSLAFEEHVPAMRPFRSATPRYSPNVFEPTVLDLISAHDALLSFFPHELVYIILDHAGYRARVTGGRSLSVDVHATNSRADDGTLEIRDGTLCYFVAPPILESRPRKDVRLKVVRVEYILVSGPTSESWLERAIDSTIDMDSESGYDHALEHSVAWNADGAVAPGIREVGGGEGAGFIERLTSGDRIAVIAKAVYPAWYNTVKRVDVSVYYGLI
ncbi:hypothetical protein C8R44DRAFT_978169 [Mycena epipterygia]|nr:hypothetical protein C8R44DRAFT_978169 [Mycena epipterygia]